MWRKEDETRPNYQILDSLIPGRRKAGWEDREKLGEEGKTGKKSGKGSRGSITGRKTGKKVGNIRLKKEKKEGGRKER